jgi:hypothetical protein
MAEAYPIDRRGTVERIDKPREDRDVERVLRVVWDGPHRRTVTIERHGGEARLVVRGTADDVVYWLPLDGLKGYAIFAMDLDVSKAPRTNRWGETGPVLIVTLLVQKLDAGQQEEPWNVITDFIVDK